MIRAGLAFVLALSLLIPPRAAAAELPVVASAQIDAVFSDFAKADTPGYAVGVVRDGELIFAKGYGQANLDDGVPITPKTRFHLASLSKQFTGAAVALLILDGKLSLEDPVARYIPEAAKFGPDLKIKHLVYMTSGVRDYTTLPRKSGQPWFSAYYFTRDEAISTSLAQPDLAFKPGTQWAYSNLNYMLLTKVVEQVSGQSFADFAQARLFAPLGMTASHIDDDSTAIVPNRAVGYAPRSPEIVAEAAKVGVTLKAGPGYARLIRNAPHFGGSGVFSNLEDLARWEGNWTSGKVGGPGFYALTHRREKFAHDKDNDAFGLVFGQYEGRTMVWYSGGDMDASTYIARFPDQKLTVVCLSNMLTGDCEGRGRKVMKVLLDAGMLASP